MKRNLTFGIQAAVLCCALIVSSSHAADSTVNYDTAWTYVYDGGSNLDILYDVKVLPNGTSVCVGESADTVTGMANTVMIKLDATGRVKMKKLFNTSSTVEARYNSQFAHSITVARNGDFIIGGVRYIGPFLTRMDTSGNIKWATWYYDSTKGLTGNLLSAKGVINSVRETTRGTIICAAGDNYPNNDGQKLSNYAAYLEFDSTGKLLHWSQWNGILGYNIGGFDIEETKTGKYLLSGNQAVFYLDTNGAALWKKQFTFMLDGVGSEVNNITRGKMLNDSTLVVAGQAYEGNCWTKYQHLYYDAWWSPISYAYGTNATWDTAGAQGGSDGLYDFTQLNNGNLVFVGTKATPADSGVWIYVTAATGNQLLWEKQYNLPGFDAGGNPLTTMLPLSVCATPDSGFTIVGDNNTFGNNHNAFAMHFVPRPPLAVSRAAGKTTEAHGFFTRIIGTRLLVSCGREPALAVTASLYNASGKLVAMQKGKTGISFDISQLSKGVYLVRLETNSGAQFGKVIVQKDKDNQALICRRFLSSLASV